MTNFTYKKDKDDIWFYENNQKLGVFDIKENEFTFFHNELTFADIEFIYKTLSQLTHD